jgi:hypothetical protein
MWTSYWAADLPAIVAYANANNVQPGELIIVIGDGGTVRYPISFAVFHQDLDVRPAVITHHVLLR